ncbi:unnamed protein product, partial [Musa hybrid cultivar]
RAYRDRSHKSDHRRRSEEDKRRGAFAAAAVSSFRRLKPIVRCSSSFGSFRFLSSTYLEVWDGVLYSCGIETAICKVVHQAYFDHFLHYLGNSIRCCSYIIFTREIVIKLE